MSAQFTPGPWTSNEFREVLAPNERTIARAHLDSRTRTDAETMANARLIAAAPDLLAALIDIVENEQFSSILRWGAARDAIAKAEGRHD